jgi:DNA-binding transcriptional MerR regulator
MALSIEKTKELLQKCIDAELSLDELREYLDTDLETDPKEWIAEKGKRQTDKDGKVQEYINQKFSEPKNRVDRD